MNCDKCSTSDAELYVGKLTAKSVAALHDLTFGPDKVRDWGSEVEELRQLARELWAACLASLVKRLVTVCEAGDGDGFRDGLFEALVAKKMLHQGAVLEYEPPAYGKNPSDFLVRVGDRKALVECVRPKTDWDEKLRSMVEGKLRSPVYRKLNVEVVLSLAEAPASRGAEDENEKPPSLEDAAERVLKCAKETLKTGCGGETRVLEGEVAARVCRKADGSLSSVRWDPGDPTSQWAPGHVVQAEQVTRVEALRSKAVRKFGGLAKDDISALVRVLVVYRAGWLVNPNADRVQMSLQWRRHCGEETIGESLRRHLDAMVFARSFHPRLVADLDFYEALVFTKEEERRTRLRSLFSGLGWCPEYICCV